jgi:hypothetical protein
VVNEVKEVCVAALDGAPALDGAAPPLPDGPAMLAIARRSLQVRARLAAAGASLAVVAIVATVGVVAGALGRPAVTTDQRVAAPVGKPAPARVVAPPPAPSAMQAHSHGLRIAGLLVAAVPAGYTTTVEHISADASPASTWQTMAGDYFSSVRVLVASGGREGQLSSHIVTDGQSMTDDDLCTAAAAERFARLVDAPATNCAVVTIDGVSVQVSTGVSEQFGQINAAVRLIDGGLLAVVVGQRIPSYPVGDDDPPPDPVTAPQAGLILGGRPGLPAPALTREQVAALAANPAMLP